MFQDRGCTGIYKRTESKYSFNKLHLGRVRKDLYVWLVSWSNHGYEAS